MEWPGGGVALGGPPPFPGSVGGCGEGGLCALPRGWVFQGGGWERHGVCFVPLRCSVGASERNVYFCKQRVKVEERGGREGVLAPGKPPHGIAPSPPPPQASHHSGSASERTERLGLTGLGFLSARCDVPNKSVGFWGRDSWPAAGQ